MACIAQLGLIVALQHLPTFENLSAHPKAVSMFVVLLVQSNYHTFMCSSSG